MHDSTKKKSAVREVLLDPERAGQRLDNFLLSQLRGAPRALVYRLLRTGQVRVNGGRARPGRRLEAGDRVRIPPLRLDERPRPTPPRLEYLEQAVLYEDDRVLVLNKPAGLAVHGGSGLSHGLIEALRVLRPGERGLELVHRLDRDTSGCLLVAKRRSALRWLHRQMREQGLRKRYLALVQGHWPRRRTEVDAPLKKNQVRGGERLVRVDPAGQAAVSRFRVIRRFAGATLLEVELVTGRTHQIRVHTAHLGHPILGDEKYGDPAANGDARSLGLRRLFLHAAEICWQAAEGEPRHCVTAPLEEPLEKVLEKLP